MSAVNSVTCVEVLEFADSFYAWSSAGPDMMSRLAKHTHSSDLTGNMAQQPRKRLWDHCDPGQGRFLPPSLDCSVVRNVAPYLVYIPGDGRKSWSSVVTGRNRKLIDALAIRATHALCDVPSFSIHIFIYGLLR